MNTVETTWRMAPMAARCSLLAARKLLVVTRTPA
jgi:hypothetical protein